MCDIHHLRHLGVNTQEGVAVGGEHGVGDILFSRVVGPVALGEEVLASHVAKSGHPVAGVGSKWTIGRHEVSVKEVVDTPDVGIVDEGIGRLGGAEHTDGTCVLTIIGTTHPRFAEAVLVVVEFAREAVDGHDERQLAYVVHLVDVAIAHGGFAPACLQAMVAVLQPERAFVDGLHHEFGSAIVPVS
ncbi:MAG: hypothetical protein F083_2769 [bacterium F083]|nr:MAG: hypothetical protein F083_2769 [bacterium F083]